MQPTESDPYLLIQHMSLRDLEALVVARDDVRRIAAEQATAAPSPSCAGVSTTAPTMRARVLELVIDVAA
jgi:hypothetical protein